LLQLEHDMAINAASAKKRIGVCPKRNYKYLCTPVDITLSLRHGTTLSSGRLKYIWLSLYKNITRDITSFFDIHYVGYLPVETSLKVLLHSESHARKMANDTTEAFQTAAADFLQDKLIEQNIAVLEIEVTQQSVTGSNRRLQTDDGSYIHTSSLEITSSILGEYRPPPEKDFSGIIEDAIDSDMHDFEEAIRRSDEFFEIYNSIEANVIVPHNLVVAHAPSRRKRTSNSTTMTLTIILAVAITGFLLLVVGFYYYKKKSKEQEKFNDTFFQESSVLKEGKRGIASLFFPSAAHSTIIGTICDDNISAVQWTNNERRAITFKDDPRKKWDEDNFNKDYGDDEDYEIMDAHVTHASSSASNHHSPHYSDFNPNEPPYF